MADVCCDNPGCENPGQQVLNKKVNIVCLAEMGSTLQCLAGGIVIYDSTFNNIAVGSGFGFLTITEGKLKSFPLQQVPDFLVMSSLWLLI